MALNLWTLGGSPKGYNPLPAGLISNSVSINGFSSYELTLRAKSVKRGRLRITDSSAGGYTNNAYYNLTADFSEIKYTLALSQSINETVFLSDADSMGDVIIENIQLVEKPLGAATINGVDGFASGKWILSGNNTVVDDETLIADARTGHAINYLTVDVMPWQTYTVKVENPTAGHIGVFDETAAVLIAAYTTAETLTFNSGNRTKVRIYLRNITNNFVLHTFKRPQLVLGSTPAPYSKKTGTRMVKPEARKNLIPGFYDSWFWNIGLNFSISENYKAVLNATAVLQTTKTKRFPIKAGADFVFRYKGTAKLYVYAFTSSGAGTALVQAQNSGIHKFKTPNDAVLLEVNFTNLEVGTFTVEDFQMEEGTTATPYEPYAVQQNAKPRKAVQAAPKGLVFDGVRDYLQLPSMTMDSVEIDCMIDAVQPNATRFFVDMRQGTSDYAYNSNKTPGLKMQVDGVETTNYQTNKRTKFVFSRTAFTDDITIFNTNSATPGYAMRGTLYGVKCYLAGQLVAAYDFTQPGAVIGDKVLPAPQNLIPPFDDKRWSLHANFRVLGRDVGRLEATGVQQHSFVEIAVKKNTSIKLSAELNGSVSRIYLSTTNSVAGAINFLSENIKEVTINTQGNEKLFILFGNGGAGTYHFTKPQLYELPATAGTLYGAPRVNDKPALRTLYAKR